MAFYLSPLSARWLCYFSQSVCYISQTFRLKRAISQCCQTPLRQITSLQIAIALPVKRCLPRVVKMLVYPPKQASFTLLLGILYCVGRHLNDPWKASLTKYVIFSWQMCTILAETSRFLLKHQCLKGFQHGRSCFETSRRPTIDLPSNLPWHSGHDLRP